MCVDELLGRSHPPEVFVMFREPKICAHTSRSPRTITGRPDAINLDAVPFVATLGWLPRLLARVRIAGTTHRLNADLHIRARSQCHDSARAFRRADCNICAVISNAIRCYHVCQALIQPGICRAHACPRLQYTFGREWIDSRNNFVISLA